MSSISNFIWNIADSVLRDHYVRGKYRDVILPMTVIRRLDAVLAPTKDDVLTKNAEVENLGFNDEARAQLLTQITGVSFFNTSPFTLASLAASDNPQRLRADFEATEHSKTFPNEAFGYRKVTVKHPLRVKDIDGARRYSASEIREFKRTGYAIVIDAAHSGQGGSAATEMGRALGDYSFDGEMEDYEDAVNAAMESRRLLPSLTAVDIALTL